MLGDNRFTASKAAPVLSTIFDGWRTTPDLDWFWKADVDH